MKRYYFLFLKIIQHTVRPVVQSVGEKNRKYQEVTSPFGGSWKSFSMVCWKIKGKHKRRRSRRYVRKALCRPDALVKRRLFSKTWALYTPPSLRRRHSAGKIWNQRRIVRKFKCQSPLRQPWYITTFESTRKHSSRMHSTRLLTICRSIPGITPGVWVPTPTERTCDQIPAPPLWTDTHLWKHYLIAISFAGGKNIVESRYISRTRAVYPGILHEYPLRQRQYPWQPVTLLYFQIAWLPLLKGTTDPLNKRRFLTMIRLLNVVMLFIVTGGIQVRLPVPHLQVLRASFEQSIPSYIFRDMITYITYTLYFFSFWRRCW